MYIHKRCRPETIDLDYDMVQFGYCDICKVQGTIYHVKGSDDYFKTKRGGVTREYRDGVDVTSEPRGEAKFASEQDITADNETMPEPIAESVDSDMEEAIEDARAGHLTKHQPQPDTAVVIAKGEAEIETTAEELEAVAARAKELEAEKVTLEVKGDRELAKDIVESVAAKKAKYAEIAKLKEQIAELEAKEE